MAINLQKGQKIDLTKGREGLSSITVGLGWDPVKKRSFFGFGGNGPSIDCDASVLMLNSNNKLVSNSAVVYFGNRHSNCGSVKHSGDNLTGAGEGDDEQIFVDLKKVPGNVHKLVFVVNIYQCVERNQDFGMIKNAFIRVVDSAKNEELVYFNLSEDHSGATALFAGEIYRDGNEWKFSATGDATRDTGLGEIANKYTK
ncbi:TerD family protein [Priestia megaterium]|uniref:TerD family protein n=1 Tax=Priestia megaterium TaxID=1404 RepID=UPI0023647114|nr:TerD family protein [Priestia megaterium]MDD1514215.1 TerD family protein [Priestia megaterium]